MAKGAKAKENITNLIISALGGSYAGTADKKIYAWADDGGEQVQIAISLTMPKVTIGAPATNTNDWTGGATIDNAVPAVVATESATTISPEDEAKVQELMRQLNII